ncbi:hypothetical protein ACQ4PT_034002 [Festuca glaucescens]
MGPLGHRGLGLLHGDCSSERPWVRRRGRSRRFRRDGHRVDPLCGDVSHFGLSNADSHYEISSTSDELVVYYLDCLDFGVHIAGSGVPRAVSWCGDMIKEYSELDRTSRRGFGWRRMKNDLPSCYLNRVHMSNKSGMKGGAQFESMLAQQKRTMHEKFGMILSGKTIDGIVETIQCFNSSELGITNKLENLSHDVLQFLSNARPWYRSSNAILTDVRFLDTPVALPGDASVKNSNITAPEMHPLAKVKTRLSLHVPDNPDTGFCQSDLISPIGRMNLSPCPGGKEGTKVEGIPLVKKCAANKLKGSKQAPIPVADTTPKAVLPKNSPEVSITGTINFKDWQSELAMEANAVYNRNVHRKRSEVRNSVRNVVTSLPDLADVEHKTHASPYQTMISCTTLLLSNWLTLNAFRRTMPSYNHPTKSGRHYFFSYIGESILLLSNEMHESLVRTSFLGAATASKGKRLDFSDRLFFPICHLEHWFMFVVDFKFKLFAFLDSFYGSDSDYQLSVRGPLIKNFIILWEKIFHTNEPNFKVFKVMTPNMPRQGNPHDCGIFLMKSLEVLVPTKDLRKEFSKNDILHLRIQFANLLFFHAGNKADRSLVTNFYVKWQKEYSQANKKKEVVPVPHS